jgi:hypothetical protein
MKLFHFYRSEDQSGVSGTGLVAEGVQLTNGWCVLRWISRHSSLCFYQTLDQVRAIHSHGGKTEILVHEVAPLPIRITKTGIKRFEILMQIIEEASRLTVVAEERQKREIQVEISTQKLRELVDLLEQDIAVHKRRSA